jgi:hypothetical protein
MNPVALSSAGAEGIAQFMPATWATHGVDANGDGVADIWDPADAIPSAAAYDCQLGAELSSVPGDVRANMLAAYNAGVYAVLQNHGVPPYAKTQAYVSRILALEPSFAAVAVHKVSVAAELGDVQIAAELGPRIDTSSLPAERRVRHALEVARAHSALNRPDEGLGIVLAAEADAPEQVRYHFISRELVLGWVRNSRAKPRPELRQLAERLHVA